MFILCYFVLIGMVELGSVKVSSKDIITQFHRQGLILILD